MLVPHPFVLLGLRSLLLFWVGFIAFASLVRFNFTFDALTLETWWYFLDPNPFKPRTGRAGLAWDVGINVVLFMPIGIGLWIHDRWAPIPRLGVTRLVGLAIGYSVILQVLQLWLPRRVASLSDAVWNTVGLLTGVFIAWLTWKAWSEIRSSLPRNLSRSRSSR